jgi:pimeloyl-ACP methyl ester carboxylesterase
MPPVVSRRGRPCRRPLLLSPVSTSVTPRSTASASITRRSAMVRRSSFCRWSRQLGLLGQPDQGSRSRHNVIVADSRGHGRSTRDARPYGYDLMVDDVVALLDTLHIAKADVVGWSDGGILGLPHEGDAVPAANRLHATAPSPDGQVRGLDLAANVNRRRPSSHAGPALALAPLLP